MSMRRVASSTVPRIVPRGFGVEPRARACGAAAAPAWWVAVPLALVIGCAGAASSERTATAAPAARAMASPAWDELGDPDSAPPAESAGDRRAAARRDDDGETANDDDDDDSSADDDTASDDPLGGTGLDLDDAQDGGDDGGDDGLGDDASG